MVPVSKEGYSRVAASWQNGVLALLMLGATIYVYDRNKSVMSYLEYLPVYRVELRWERSSLEDSTTQTSASSKTKNGMGVMPSTQ